MKSNRAGITLSNGATTRGIPERGGTQVHSIAAAGHLCLDLFPTLHGAIRLDPGSLTDIGPLRINLGGSVANTGGALIGLGAAVTPYANVGDDDLAPLLRAKLHHAGFDTPQLTVSRGKSTSYSLVIEEPSVDRVFWHHTGANDDFDGSSVSPEQHALLHIGYPPLLPGVLGDTATNLTNLLRRARSAEVTTSLDLAVVDSTSKVGALDWSEILRAVLPLCDIVTPSLDDLTSAWNITEPYSVELVEHLAQKLLDHGVGVAAISAGPHGLHLKTASEQRLTAGGDVLKTVAAEWADKSVTVSALPVQDAVTTTGAGDASSAGLLFGLMAGASPERSCALAVAAAAVSLTGERPTPASVCLLDPTLSEVF